MKLTQECIWISKVRHAVMVNQRQMIDTYMHAYQYDQARHISLTQVSRYESVSIGLDLTICYGSRQL